MNKKVLVAGGTGFLGRNLVPMLEATDKYDVIGLGRSNGLDLLNIYEAMIAFKSVKPDVVINLAAHVGSVDYVMRHAADIIDENSRMYLNLYKVINETCPKAKVINALSNCSYPGRIDFYKESEWWNGMLHPSVESFGTAKLLLWMLAQSYSKQYGIKSVSVILPNAYGINEGLVIERMHAMNGIIARMIQAKRKGNKTFTIWGTGKPVREWIYMPDAARILMGCIEKEFEDTYFNAAQNRGISILETTKIIARLMKYDVKFVFDTSKPDGTDIKIMDDTRFRSYFPEFQFTDYEEGIKNTIQYFEKALK